MGIEKVMLLIAALLCFLLLTSLYFSISKEIKIQKMSYLEGNKEKLLKEIAEKVYQCWKMAKRKRGNFICEKITLKVTSNETIEYLDVLKALDSRKINNLDVIADNIGSEGEIVIRYEDGKIYIEKIW